jgi:hypothetical protein
MPTTSYNGSKGAPLPYEIDCADVSIKIAFQGGDSKYMVGAFSIEKPRAADHTLRIIRPWLCKKKKGSL